MTALIIIGSILLLLALIIFVPLTATLVYENELRAYARVLCVRIKLFPRKKKKKRGPHSMSRRKAAKILASIEKKKQKKALKKKKKQLKKEEKEAKEGKKSFSDTLSTISSVTSIASDGLKRFGKRFHVRISVMQITVATPDAAKTAITYGAIESALAQLYATLGQCKNFKLPKDSKFFLNADFSKTETTAKIKIHFSFSIFAILAAAIGALLKDFIRKTKEKAYIKAKKEALAKRAAQRRAQKNISNANNSN